ncbi:MAG TPA: hypothetical protein VGE60_00775 [Telluria sp.]
MKNHWLEMIATVAMSVIALMCVLAIWPSLAGADGAAWAQGLLTGLGICLALYTTDRQLKASRMQRDDERMAANREKRQSVAVMASHAKELIDQFYYACVHQRQSFYFEDWAPGQFKSAADMFRAIPLYELGSYNMVSGVMELITSLEQNETLAKYLAGQEHDAPSLLSEHWVREQARWSIVADKALIKIDGGAYGWSDEQIMLMCDDHGIASDAYNRMRPVN